MSSEVPNGWRPGRLGEFLKAAQGGGTPPRDNPAYWGRDLPWASVKDVTSGADEPLEGITAEGLENSSSRRVVAGTNILATRMAVGTVVRYGVDVAINQDLLALTPTASLDPDFLFHWLRHHSARFSDVATGTTVKGLRKDILLNWPMLVPPLDEQRRIADVLRSVDTVVSAATTEIAAIAALRVSLLESWLVDWQSQNETTQLKEIVSLMDSGWSPECEGEAADAGEWAVLKTSAVTWNGYDETQNKRLPTSLMPREQAQVAEGDILITRAGQAYRTGVVSFVRRTVGMRMISDKIVRLKANDALVKPRLLAAMLAGRSVQRQLNPLKSGLTTLTNITQKMIGAVEVPIPSMSDQEQAVLALESLDERVERGTWALTHSLNLKSALESDLLTGRVRVPA